MTKQNADQAKTIITLFAERAPDGKGSVGAEQFVGNLNIIRALNKDDASRPYQIEHAFLLTLKKNGLNLPINDLLAYGQTFNH